MQEIEVKILEVDIEATIKKLEALGAEKVSDGELDVVLFDYDDRSIAKANSLLRLRKNAGDVELTLKTRISKEKTKIMKEFEVNVSDYEKMIQILKGLGLKEFGHYSKHRISYRLDDVKFEFDTLPGIPTYLEVEAPSEEKVKEYVEKIGFSMSDAKAWSGKDILDHYGKTNAE